MSAFTPTPTSPLRVAAGRAAVFDFPPISSVPLPAVTWQADDGSGLHGQKYETTTDNRLVILSVDSGDSKKYRYGGRALWAHFILSETCVLTTSPMNSSPDSEYT